MDTNFVDPTVFTFMMELVQKKHGNDLDSKFLQEEAMRLYNEFGDKLVEQFEPMLTDEQKSQFDELVRNGADQDKLLEFIIGAIPNIEDRLQDALFRFKDDYMAS